MRKTLTAFLKGSLTSEDFSSYEFSFDDRFSNYTIENVYPVGGRSNGEITNNNNSQKFSGRIDANDDFQSRIRWNLSLGVPTSLFTPPYYPKNIDSRLLSYPNEQQDKYFVKDEAGLQKTIEYNMLQTAFSRFNIFVISSNIKHNIVKLIRDAAIKKHTEEKISTTNKLLVAQNRSISINWNISRPNETNPMGSICQFVNRRAVSQVLMYLLQCILKPICYLFSLLIALCLLLKQERPRSRADSDSIEQGKSKTPICVIPEPSASPNTINILLLGETGVGKSTFINAFANYLTFDTLPQAPFSEPVVLIPVSFLITTGDNFEEHMVKFTNIEDAENEDFAHPGQSVTQHCRPYAFNLKNSDGRKLQIIDTPGFIDTRGLAQDDYNMEHICQYLKKLSHLDVVCFLLKPNESRLNIFFRLCMARLFDIAGPNIAKKIVFCFTNSRSTFYTPGNTGPLVKQVLQSLAEEMTVLFKKENVFCFDNESFRYLVARQNNIPFTDSEKEDYEASWKKSVTEAKRFVRYVDTNLIQK